MTRTARFFNPGLQTASLIIALSSLISALQSAALSAEVQDGAEAAPAVTAAPATVPAGMTVVDSKGKVVGTLLSAGLVLRQVNG